MVSRPGGAEAHDVLRGAVPQHLTAAVAACERREPGLKSCGEAKGRKERKTERKKKKKKKKG